MFLITVPSPHIVVSHDGGNVFTAGSRLTVTCTITIDGALTSNDVRVYGFWYAQNQECGLHDCKFPTHPKNIHVNAFQGVQTLENGIYVRNVTLVFDVLYISHGDIYTCRATVREDDGRSQRSSSAIEITVKGTVDHY